MWYWQPVGFSLVLLCSFPGLLLASIGGSAIFVKQNGQASYVSAESCCKFKVLSGVVKVFLHAGFRQLTILFPRFSLDNETNLH